MNRTETEAAISGYLPRRARRHLDAIMAAVDAHAAAGREDLDRVVAEGARRQKLVAEEFRRVKAEAAELGKQVRVLVEERAAALAEGNRLRQERAEQDQAFGGAVRRIHDLTAEVGEAATERDRLRQQLDDIAAEHAVRVSELEAADAENTRLRQELAQADAQLEIRTNMITNLEAERDRLREQLADRTDLLTNRENLIGYRIGDQVHHPADVTIVYRNMVIEGEHGPELVTLTPAPAPGGDAEPAPRKPRTRKPAGGNS